MTYYLDYQIKVYFISDLCLVGRADDCSLLLLLSNPLDHIKFFALTKNYPNYLMWALSHELENGTILLWVRYHVCPFHQSPVIGALPSIYNFLDQGTSGTEKRVNPLNLFFKLHNWYASHQNSDTIHWSFGPKQLFIICYDDCFCMSVSICRDWFVSSSYDFK